jgi:maltose O-acetyltransferase
LAYSGRHVRHPEVSMPSEKEKMLAGELYDPLDPNLVRARDRARDLCQELNATREIEHDARRRILKELFGSGGDSVWMQPPFFCDYGSNILLGERVFFNSNCVVLDVCQVKIGSKTVIGAGSVVTRDIPDEVFAAGNPCRVIRGITE